MHGAAELIDPRPFAVGSIAKTFERYPHVGELLPAMGYGRKQMEELRETIERSGADLVLIGTPIDLRRGRRASRRRRSESRIASRSSASRPSPPSSPSAASSTRQAPVAG